MPYPAAHAAIALGPAHGSAATRQAPTVVRYTPISADPNRTVRQQNPTVLNRIEPFASKRLDAARAALAREPSTGAINAEHPAQPFNRSSFAISSRPGQPAASPGAAIARSLPTPILLDSGAGPQ
jgi:hypothetical protein